MRKIILLLAAIILIASNFTTAADIPALREMDPVNSLDSYVTLGEWNTDGDFESWTYNADISDCAVYGGSITGTVSGADEHIDLNLSTAGKYVTIEKGSVIELRCRYDAGTANAWGQWFVNGTADRVVFVRGAGEQPSDGAFHIYRATVTGNYKVVASSFRIDQYSGQAGSTFEVDYFRVMTPRKMVDANFASSKTFTYTSLGEWNTPGDWEYWTTNQISDCAVFGGSITGTVSGSDEYIDLNLASAGKSVTIQEGDIIQFRCRYDASTANNWGQWFINGTSERSVFVYGTTEQPLDGAFHTYTTVAVDDYISLTGVVSTFRIDQYSGQIGSTFDMDYVRIGRLTAVPEPVTIGFLALLGLAFLRKK